MDEGLRPIFLSMRVFSGLTDKGQVKSIPVSHMIKEVSNRGRTGIL